MYHKVLFGHHYCLIFTFTCPSVIKHCLVVGYANYHTFLITIPHRDNRATAAGHLKTNLADYGHQLEHHFGSFKDIIINDFRSCIHLYFITIFVFLKLPQSGCLDSSLTWQQHIDSVLGHGKQCLSVVNPFSEVRIFSPFTNPVFHLLDCFQTCVENICVE